MITLVWEQDIGYNISFVHVKNVDQVDNTFTHEKKLLSEVSVVTFLSWQAHPLYCPFFVLLDTLNVLV